jgi:hypothetical protein
MRYPHLTSTHPKAGSQFVPFKYHKEPILYRIISTIVYTFKQWSCNEILPLDCFFLWSITSRFAVTWTCIRGVNETAEMVLTTPKGRLCRAHQQFSFCEIIDIQESFTKNLNWGFMYRYLYFSKLIEENNGSPEIRGRAKNWLIRTVYKHIQYRYTVYKKNFKTFGRFPRGALIQGGVMFTMTPSKNTNKV